MKHTYTPHGVCSTKIEFELENGTIHDLVFTGGCNGNLKAIAKMVEGMEANRVVAMLSGITCDSSSTSCADQLARAIVAAQRVEARK